MVVGFNSKRPRKGWKSTTFKSDGPQDDSIGPLYFNIMHWIEDIFSDCVGDMVCDAHDSHTAKPPMAGG